MAKSVGAVYSGSMLFASILNSSVMFGNYLQQRTSADAIFRCIFFGFLFFYVVVFRRTKNVQVTCKESPKYHFITKQILCLKQFSSILGICKYSAYNVCNK